MINIYEFENRRNGMFLVSKRAKMIQKKEQVHLLLRLISLFQNWKAKRSSEEIRRWHLDTLSSFCLFKALSFPVPLVLTSLFLFLSPSESETDSFRVTWYNRWSSVGRGCWKGRNLRLLKAERRGFIIWRKVSERRERRRRKREKEWWLSVLFLKYTKDEGEKVL